MPAPKHALAGDGEIHYVITDLVPLEKLQKIQDAFAKGNDIASTLTDLEGVPITVPSNHSPVCALIRNTAKGLANCIYSGKQLGRKARENLAPIRQSCCSIGFTDAAAPIIVNGRHIANWLIGQFQVGKVDAPRVREYAKEIGADPDQMVRAFQTMPKLTMEQLDNKLSFLGIMANELSRMGYQNLVQRLQAEELNKIREQLEGSQGHLEQLVLTRTADLRQANRQLTEEMAEKSRIQKRQNRLVTAIESAAESVVITSPAGTIIYVNPAFSELTGYSPAELLGNSPRLLKSGFHDDHFYHHLWQTITGGQTWVGRFVNRKKDGTIYQEESTISPVKDEKGGIVNFVAVKRDITKEIEMQRQLIQAQRLESIGILAAGVAHEINTPIQYILSNTQFFKEVLTDLRTMQAHYDRLIDTVSTSGSFTDEIREIAEAAEAIDLASLWRETGGAVEQSLAGIHRIADIVRAMKEFARPGGVSRQPEDLNALISATVTVSRSKWQDYAEVELELDPSLPAVPLLSGRIKQVLLGMIFNATHALAEKNGDPPRTKGRLAISTRHVNDQAELRVADNGIGIPDDIIDKIFDPFFTTRPVGKGSGQGLSIAHGVIVDNHKGSIRVESVPGVHTEFIITLPLRC